METVINLKDLLKHEILDLYSAEEQIIEALPLMIEKAGNANLKAALKEHLKITEQQKARLDEIKQIMGEDTSDENSNGKEGKGFFSRLFGSGGEKCKGMEGLITEGQKMMAADMSPEAGDAAIIGSAQKIEHYEISGYGTARAYARELKLNDVVTRLEQTLNEEYEADDILTQLAVGKVNIEAQAATGMESGRSKSSSRGGSKAAAKKGGQSNAAKKSSGKSSSSKFASKSSASKSGSSGKGRSSQSNSSKGSKSKTAAKKSSSKSSKGGNKSSSKNKSSRGR